MGAHFSSNQLAGGTESAVPVTSYAYATTNANYLGADATYTFDGGQGFPFAPLGLVTPYLVSDPAAPQITCSPFSAFSTDQSLSCPIAGTSLTPGLYTLSFSQYSSTTTTDDSGSVITVLSTPGPSGAPNTLSDPGGDFTFSIVAPTFTTTVTPVNVTSTTIISGISEVLPSATDTVPATSQTVTVYLTTIVSTSTYLSTLSGVSSVFTVTASCTKKSTSSSSKSSSSSLKITTTSKSSTKTSSSVKTTSTLKSCTKDTCLTGLLDQGPLALIFCDLFMLFPAAPIPVYASGCLNVASKISSACHCCATPAPKVKARGIVAIQAGPPDYTYDADNPQPTVTYTAPPPSTVTSGPFPSATSYDPDVITSIGTSTIIDSESYTLTTTVISTTVDARSVSTTTVSASC